MRKAFRSVPQGGIPLSCCGRGAWSITCACGRTSFLPAPASERSGDLPSIEQASFGCSDFACVRPGRRLRLLRNSRHNRQAVARAVAGAVACRKLTCRGCVERPERHIRHPRQGCLQLVPRCCGCCGPAVATPLHRVRCCRSSRAWRQHLPQPRQQLSWEGGLCHGCEGAGVLQGGLPACRD